MKYIKFLKDLDINGIYEVSKGLKVEVKEELDNGYVWQLTEDRIVAPKSEEGITFEVAEE